MGQITSLFVRKVVGVVEDALDKDDLLKSLGIDPDSAADPSQMVSDTDYYSFLEKIAITENNGTTLPLRAGAAMRCDDYGAFGLAWKSATNLGGSYERAERYARVLTSVSTYTVERIDQGAFIHLQRIGDRRLGMRLSNEATIASIVSISRQVSTKPFTPLAVYFKHQAPKRIRKHQAYFGCPMHFDADRDALLVSNESLRTPNQLGDKSISQFFDTHLETELSKLADPHSLEHQVRIYVSRCLSEGVPTISDVAEHFTISGRTLQRRLSELGYSYQTLVDESRRQLAERLLQQTDYSLAEVAFMTGFSEQSAFTRAFKRWAGQTPRSFRLNLQTKPN
ncbi:AraC family transcriptional regulator [Picosynechococcus sp. PCC 73109]|uniref:AraC family transcriptional regulator n=1 Tax=Picosynechococcus sp. PCC 73109 TaxID=374982 RepID=UPI00074580A7|nr:AraC family transcriptional regulator [Picosynechococcus sp. PCC 73109]AMA10781.1 AraC family transcriptional regulator [Picosynechococcus sp. PCC 73109]